MHLYSSEKTALAFIAFVSLTMIKITNYYVYATEQITNIKPKSKCKKGRKLT